MTAFDKECSPEVDLSLPPAICDELTFDTPLVSVPPPLILPPMDIPIDCQSIQLNTNTNIQNVAAGAGAASFEASVTGDACAPTLNINLDLDMPGCTSVAVGEVSTSSSNTAPGSLAVREPEPCNFEIDITFPKSSGAGIHIVPVDCGSSNESKAWTVEGPMTHEGEYVRVLYIPRTATL